MYFDGTTPLDFLAQYIEGDFDDFITNLEGGLYKGEVNDISNDEMKNDESITWTKKVKLQDIISAEEEKEFKDFNISSLDIPDLYIGNPKLANGIQLESVIWGRW